MVQIHNAPKLLLAGLHPPELLRPFWVKIHLKLKNVTFSYSNLLGP